MFATVRRYETNPSSVPELLRRANKDFMPLLRAIKGLISYDILDTGKGVILSISIFQTEWAVAESNRLASKFAKDWRDLLPHPPQVTPGRIVLHEANLRKLKV